MTQSSEVTHFLEETRGQKSGHQTPWVSICELLEAQAERCPEAPAVEIDGAALSYGRLNARANHLAGELRRRGVGPEVVVGVWLERSLESMVALVGVLKAGGVYLPLDPAYPAQRLRWMLEDSAAAVVVTAQEPPGRLPLAGLPLLSLDGELPLADALAELAGPGNLAYVIYTSGSTGRPKGVCVSHRALAEHMQAVREELELRAGDRVLQFASLSFDISLKQMLAPLLAGATVVLRGSELWPAGDFFSHAAALELTVVHLPTTYWHLVAAEAAGAEPPASLRLVYAGGEAMSAERARSWSQHLGRRVPTRNSYGPTEATITATHYPLPSPDSPATDTVPIGRPLRGRTAHVLEREGSPAPDGDAGELCLGGLLARGYLNRPAKTAEQFRPDPFAGRPGARLYRTGDLVRRMPDGALEFLGRIDHQVKVRGYRIELGEIEATLARLPGIRAAVVVAPREPSGDRRLVAYTVTEDESELGELRELLAASLPGPAPRRRAAAGADRHRRRARDRRRGARPGLPPASGADGGELHPRSPE